MITHATDPLAHRAHRPWPMPREPWVMTMTWHDLLFAHWRVPVEALRPAVPAPLAIDTFDGCAWIGVIPFLMADVRPRTWPRRLAWRFPELNVRTYVTVANKPGVYFFSLDAHSRLAVRMARWSWNLAYFDANMYHQRERAGSVVYTSTRTHRHAPAARFAARYGPVGDAAPAAPGSFEHFATERYCLYTVDRRGRPHRGEIHHAPWPLQPAAAEFDTLEMTQQIDVTLPDDPPRLHYAESMRVIAWLPHRV